MTKSLSSFLAALLALSGCAGPVSKAPPAGHDAVLSMRIKDLLPPEKGASEPDKHVRKGVLLLQKGQYAEASREFNGAVRFDPQNAYYQFFNGLAYHLIAEQGDSTQYEEAKIGYELALKFDPNLWLAALQLGRLFLSRNQFAVSQNYFAQALLQQPNDPDLLEGLAQASYHAGDLQTALGAVRRAREVSPSSASPMATEALILAAVGRSDEAKKDLAAYRSAESGSVRVNMLKEQIDSWDQLRDAPNDNPPAASTGTASGTQPTPADANHSATNEAANLSANPVPTPVAEPAALPQGSTDTAPPPPPPPDAVPAAAPAAPEPPPMADMAMIDVVMIRSEEQTTTSKGVNLMQGLQLQFGGSASFDQTRTMTAASGAAPAPGQTIKSELIGTMTVPTVTYNMNIFNAAESHNEIIARPTLIAMNGKKSEFFSGDSLDVALQGTQSATSHTIDAGVSMSVTPTMLPDGRIQIEMAASRSFFETTPAGTFTQAVSTSKNTLAVNVVMNYDQTLVLNGLREKQTTLTKSGVPFLRDIPLLQYFFSNASTLDFHKSILILLTPRHVESGIDASDPTLTHDQRVGDSLKKFRETYSALFKYDIGLTHPLGHLMKHALWLGLTKSRTFDVKWFGEPDKLSTVIQRNLSFLYY